MGGAAKRDKAARILVIEDEEVVRNTTSAILESLGYQVTTAADGQEGVAAYEKGREEIDLVLLDMVMPQMDGKECMERLRRIDPRVRVVVITGYTTPDGGDWFDLSRPDAVVAKPLTVGELGRVVAEVINRPE